MIEIVVLVSAGQFQSTKLLAWLEPNGDITLFENLPPKAAKASLSSKGALPAYSSPVRFYQKNG
jgi:hypothetical protein